MIQALLSLWVICALFIIYQQKVTRIIIAFCISSLITSVCYLLLGAPDVAMAEGAISAFITIFFIICFEKCYGFTADASTSTPIIRKLFPLTGRKLLVFIKELVVPIVFTVSLFGLFIFFIPDITANTYLKYQYTSLFTRDIGGENAVTAIYLGYRVYDTLLEALMLLVAVIAVLHLSWHNKVFVTQGRGSPLNYSKESFIIRFVCPLLLLGGMYLVINGYLTPGGGFQGGVLLAAFFICRYVVYEIYDIPVVRLISVEKLLFMLLTLLAAFVVFLGFAAHFPPAHESLFQSVYLITMNALIGLKVACGFVILFYRYIAIERR